MTVTVFDSPTTFGTGSLTVHDPAPTLVATGQSITGNEGSQVSLPAVQFSYAGESTTFSASINCGDGQITPGTVTLNSSSPAGTTTGTITGTHVYGAFGTYNVTVSVANAADNSSTVPLTAAIANLSPTVGPLPAEVIVPGQVFTITDSFNDPGFLDTHTAVINWGDGTSTQFDANSLIINPNGSTTPALVEPTATSPGEITFGHIYNDDNSHTVTLTVTDDGGLSATVSALYQDVDPTTTTVNSSTSRDTSVYGQSVTFTAIVTGSITSGGVPAGTVEFFDGTTDLGPGSTLSGSGTVATSTFSTASLTAGSHTITAIYTPGSYFVKSSGSVNQTVNQATPTITWASPAGIVFGTPLSSTQLDATASWTMGGMTLSVLGNFTYAPVAGTILGAGNNESLSVSFAPADTTDYTTASATTTINVSRHATTTTLTASTPEGAPGQPVTFTATVAGGLPSPYLPTGSVQFEINGVNAGSPVPLSASDTAVFSTTEPAAGSFTVTAVYSGDPNFSGSPSSAYSETVLTPGVFVVGTTLYVVGANTCDYALILPWGSKLNGSTGLAVVANLDDKWIAKAFTQTFTAIDVFGYGGNDNFVLSPTLTLPTTVIEGNGDNNLVLGSGNDTVTLGSGSNQVWGGNGNKTITAADAACANICITLGDGNNTINLGAGNDHVVLGGGNSSVTAGNGNDSVFTSGNGNNTVTLGNGDDSVHLGNGSNTVTLSNGNDSVSAGDGNDNVTVGNGNDNMQLGNGSDVIVEGNGKDQVTAGNGADLVVAGLGQHTITLGSGTDILIDGAATVVNSGDSLRQILSDWNTSSSASVDTRIKVVYNTSHPNVLKAGAGRDWWFYTYNKDVTNIKKTDRLN